PSRWCRKFRALRLVRRPSRWRRTTDSSASSRWRRSCTWMWRRLMMPKVSLEKMTLREIIAYVRDLEAENKELRRKTDNSKKLDARDVQKIRQLYESGNWKQNELADAFNVNDATISRIVRGIYYAAA